MIKTSIGELKLFPIKENGKFVFFNDFITINGKVSKGDSIHIYVDAYEVVNNDYIIKAGCPSATFTVRGQQHALEATEDYATVRDFYDHVSEAYKSKFYFGVKS